MNCEKNYTMTESYFFDTYAFFEVLRGNEDYKKYSKSNIITSKLNLFELYFNLMKETDERTAQKCFEKYYEFAKEFDEKIIIEAAKIKLKLNNRNVSMTDCIGYIMAKMMGIKFLTGDKEFENLENVEFVK